MVEGGRPLEGDVRISGSKNASLPIMAACLLTGERITLENVPQIADTALMGDILSSLGCEVSASGGRWSIAAQELAGHEVDADLGRRMRASVVLLGPLLARAGAARLPKPGGDEIGMRRVEIHLRGLRQMGAEIEESADEFIARAPEGLHGARVILDMPTVTGTENLVMAAVLAKGRTEIVNSAREPHVRDLCRFLSELGARIEGIGTDRLAIEGVKALGRADHTVVNDYLEAGTFAIAAAATGGDVLLHGTPTDDLEALVWKLREAGVVVEAAPDRMRVRRGQDLRPVDLLTWVHPGYPTDLQAQYLALMTQAAGQTYVSEYIFENRFQHVPALVRMGASIRVQGRTAIVDGPTQLTGAELEMSDIRAGAALVVAALCARGTTALAQAWHIERGYEDLAGKLAALGAEIGFQESGAASDRSGVTYE